MKLCDGFITRKIMDDTVLMNLHNAEKLMRLNGTAAEILALLLEGRTEAEIAAELAASYDVDAARALSDVQMCVETLRALGALEE